MSLRARVILPKPKACTTAIVAVAGDRRAGAWCDVGQMTVNLAAGAGKIQGLCRSHV